MKFNAGNVLCSDTEDQRGDTAAYDSCPWLLSAEIDGKPNDLPALGMHHGNVIGVCVGYRPTTNGYVFEYDSPTEPSLLEGEVWAEIV